MPEPSSDQGAPPSTDGPDKSPTGSLPGREYVEEGVFPRLQERTQTQLGFINSLLITLAVGLLAFAANASASSTELHRLGWRKWLILAGVVVLACSVLSGLRLAHNRLASHRITTRVARLRQLRDRYRSEHRDDELQRLSHQAVFFQKWAKYSWSKVPEKKQVQSAARNLAALIPDEYKQKRRAKTANEKTGTSSRPYIPAVPPAVTRLVEADRTWYEQADDWTWWWLKVQTGSFMLGAICLVVVPFSYY